ncbi:MULTISPECIES: helix-turn-helix transcriptional regulator [unclassified Streptomyces]|uniref:helix-turn-helix transcriptional regulator n=1 Tax=unclassified Streptomyces TaxID=2593676 RepID=UPI00342B9A23
MHADVAHSWSLKELAEISHMPRSAFARAFKSHVGTPPLEYLIQWRMSLARDALARDTLSISELARATGYRSERVQHRVPPRGRLIARTVPVPGTAATALGRERKLTEASRAQPRRPIGSLAVAGAAL